MSMHTEPIPTQTARTYVEASYYSDNPDVYAQVIREHGRVIDCALGSNPIGVSAELIQAAALTADDPFTLATRIIAGGQDYNPDVFGEASKSLLSEYYGIGNARRYPGMVEFHANGSYGAGDEIVRLFKQQSLAKGMIVTPQSFPNVNQYCDRHGLERIILDVGTLNPMESIQRMVEMGTDVKDYAVYFDTPNNPYGIFDYETLESGVRYTVENGGRPFIDLAFGDVLGKGMMNQLINLAIQNGGVAVGSMSKTFGLAAHRIGWAFVAKEIAEKKYKDSQRLVFTINSLSANLLRLLMTPDPSGSSIAERHTANSVAYNTEANALLYAGLESIGVTVFPTDLRVPIQVLSDGKDGFYQRLMGQGVYVESLNDYAVTIPDSLKAESLGDRAVRLLTPRSQTEVMEVLHRINLAVNK